MQKPPSAPTPQVRASRLLVQQKEEVSIVVGLPSLALLNSCKPQKNNFAVLKQTAIIGSYDHVDKLRPLP
jgi:hypothetical protein